MTVDKYQVCKADLLREQQSIDRRLEELYQEITAYQQACHHPVVKRRPGILPECGWCGKQLSSDC